MLSNRGGGPIIVAAQTNHALDQLLTHIAGFEGKFVRLGGRCDKGNATVLARTLYALRQTTKDIKSNHYSGVKAAYRSHNVVIESILELLLPVTQDDLLSAKILLESSVMSQEHYDSFFEPGWSSSAEMEDGSVDPLLSCRFLRAEPRQ